MLHPQKLLGKEMAYFQLQMEWCWNRLDGKFERLQEDVNGKESEDEKDEGLEEEEEEEEDEEEE